MVDRYEIPARVYSKKERKNYKLEDSTFWRTVKYITSRPHGDNIRISIQRVIPYPSKRIQAIADDPLPIGTVDIDTAHIDLINALCDSPDFVIDSVKSIEYTFIHGIDPRVIVEVIHKR